MPTKKKTTPETDTVVKAAPAEKKKTVRSATAAATHKSPARKSVAKPAAVKAFDVAAHHAEIEQEAYFLFVNRGGQHGHERADWLHAIEIVKKRY